MEKMTISLTHPSGLNLMSYYLRKEIVEGIKEYNERDPQFTSFVSEDVLEVYEREMKEIDSLTEDEIMKRYIESLKILDGEFALIYDRPFKDILGYDYNIFKKLKTKVFDYRLFAAQEGRDPLFTLIGRKDMNRFFEQLFKLKEEKYIFTIAESVFNSMIEKKSESGISHFVLGLIDTDLKKIYTSVPDKKHGEHHWDDLSPKEIKEYGL